VTSPGNYNYNGVTLTVNPAAMKTAADTIQAEAMTVSASLESIGNTLSGLQLSWAGTSAAEAQDFANQWSGAIKRIFGSSDSHPGTMNLAVNALLTAVSNYSVTEESLTTMFVNWASADWVGASEYSPAPAILAGTNAPDAKMSAVGETNWAPSLPL
jgi:Proteins of 100 residues with WXG